jgi:hypothetical protein
MRRAAASRRRLEPVVVRVACSAVDRERRIVRCEWARPPSGFDDRAPAGPLIVQPAGSGGRAVNQRGLARADETDRWESSQEGR